MFNLSRFAVLLFVLPLSLVVTPVSAEDDTPHKVVMQVSSDDAITQTIAMNNAVNLQKAYGLDNVAIEIVAYGPGLSMLIAGGPMTQRVTSLSKQEITFSACGNTIKRIEQQDGKKVGLSEGVRVVPAGVVRIVELQEQGYSYIKP